MPSLRDFAVGPWRAVPVLGVTQILAWGAVFYTPVLMVPLIAAARGWSITFAMAGFSAGLLIAGLAAPWTGRAIDRFGGHWVMAGGSLLAALGLVLVASIPDGAIYLAAWAILGLAMAASLYDAAFASLARIFGTAARAPITAVTLMGGFASTLSWPATQALIDHVGWQTAYQIYAALLVLVAAPLHAFALPRSRFTQDITDGTGKPPVPLLPARGLPFFLIAMAFAAYAFVPSALSAHLIAILQRQGLGAETAVLVGALFGPSQVAARVIEFAFGRALHPLWLARAILAVLIGAFVMLMAGGVSVWSAALFAVLFGGVNGLMTIVRGVLPLALFGAQGFGKLMGRIAMPFLIVQAAAPLVMALVVERVSDAAGLAATAAFTLIAFVCMVVLRRPGASG